MKPVSTSASNGASINLSFYEEFLTIY